MEDARLYLIDARRGEELRRIASERLVRPTKQAEPTSIGRVQPGQAQVQPRQPQADPVRPGTAARSSA